MGEHGLLGPVLGFADPGRLVRLAAIEAATRLAPDGVLRLAALALFVSEDASRLAERLRLSNSERDRLTSAASALAPLHGASAAPSEDVLRRLLFRFGRIAASDALMLAHAEADVGPGDSDFARARRFLSETPAPRSPIGGKDLIARGLGEGPRIGEILQAFHRLWGEAGFPADAESVERLVRAAAEDPGAGRARGGDPGQ